MTSGTLKITSKTTLKNRRFAINQVKISRKLAVELFGEIIVKKAEEAYNSEGDFWEDLKPKEMVAEHFLRVCVKNPDVPFYKWQVGLSELKKRKVILS